MVTRDGQNFPPVAGSKRLLAGERRIMILRLIRERGSVRVADLAASLDVSAMTIRRDIDTLHDQQQLQKVHGGATLVGYDLRTRSAEEPGFSAKSALQQEQKERIAAAAGSLIEPGSAIGITAGTTTYKMAAHLDRIADLTVVTNSMPLVLALSQGARPDLTVVICGGTPTPSAAIVGPLAEQALSALHLDQLFMGVHGIGSTGFTTPNLTEAMTNQAFIRAADQIIVMADATKWGTTGLSRIAPLDMADILITDDSLSPEAQAELSENISKVMLL